MKNGMAECSVCRSRLVSPSSKAISRAYDNYNYKIRVSSKQRALNVFLVVGDCMLVGLQVTFSYNGLVNTLAISVLLLPCIISLFQYYYYHAIMHHISLFNHSQS